MPTKFAIPSYNRVDILKSNTIAMLEHYKIPKKQIYIFVVEEEYQQYKDALPDYKNIIIGVKGLYNQRNFITNYFKHFSSTIISFICLISKCTKH